jgi:hypothetical protein
MSVDPANDWNLWKWVVGLIGSMLSGAAVGGWIARGMMESIQQRVATLERDQSRCQATLKEGIRSIVQQAVDQQDMRNANHLQAIRTELAVLVALHGETQKDVQSIFERMDSRRQDFSSPTPHGERRDQ